jgi:penicillin amidase
VPGVVRWLFNPAPVRLGGGASIVNATGWNAAVPRDYSVNWVPSMRMVIDLSDLDASTWVDLTGVSGHPWSPYYTDQLNAWREGDTYPWPFTRGAVEKAEKKTLVLAPKPQG